MNLTVLAPLLVSLLASSTMALPLNVRPGIDGAPVPGFNVGNDHSKGGKPHTNRRPPIHEGAGGYVHIPESVGNENPDQRECPDNPDECEQENSHQRRDSGSEGFEPEGFTPEAESGPGRSSEVGPHEESSRDSMVKRNGGEPEGDVDTEVGHPENNAPRVVEPTEGREETEEGAEEGNEGPGPEGRPARPNGERAETEEHRGDHPSSTAATSPASRSVVGPAIQRNVPPDLALSRSGSVYNGHIDSESSRGSTRPSAVVATSIVVEAHVMTQSSTISTRPAPTGGQSAGGSGGIPGAEAPLYPIGKQGLVPDAGGHQGLPLVPYDNIIPLPSPSPTTRPTSTITSSTTTPIGTTTTTSNESDDNPAADGSPSTSNGRQNGGMMTTRIRASLSIASFSHLASNAGTSQPLASSPAREGNGVHDDTETTGVTTSVSTITTPNLPVLATISAVEHPVFLVQSSTPSTTAGQSTATSHETNTPVPVEHPVYPLPESTVASAAYESTTQSTASTSKAASQPATQSSNVHVSTTSVQTTIPATFTNPASEEPDVHGTVGSGPQQSPSTIASRGNRTVTPVQTVSSDGSTVTAAQLKAENKTTLAVSIMSNTTTSIVHLLPTNSSLGTLSSATNLFTRSGILSSTTWEDAAPSNDTTVASAVRLPTDSDGIILQDNSPSPSTNASYVSSSTSSSSAPTSTLFVSTMAPNRTTVMSQSSSVPFVSTIKPNTTKAPDQIPTLTSHQNHSFTENPNNNGETQISPSQRSSESATPPSKPLQPSSPNDGLSSTTREGGRPTEYDLTTEFRESSWGSGSEMDESTTSGQPEATFTVLPSTVRATPLTGRSSSAHETSTASVEDSGVTAKIQPVATNTTAAATDSVSLPTTTAVTDSVPNTHPPSGGDIHEQVTVTSSTTQTKSNSSRQNPTDTTVDNDSNRTNGRSGSSSSSNNNNNSSNRSGTSSNESRITTTVTTTIAGGLHLRTTPGEGMDTSGGNETIDFPIRPSFSSSMRFVEIKLRMTLSEFCNNEPTFCLELADILREQGQQDTFTVDQIRLMSDYQKTCADQGTVLEEEVIDVQLYLVNKTNHYDGNLTEACFQIIKQAGFGQRERSLFKDKLLGVELIEMDGENSIIPSFGTPAPNLEDGVNTGDEDDDDSFISQPGVTIAVVIAVVGGACCVTLIVMQIVLRHRYRDGMRTLTSRSYSATSVDSIALAAVAKSRPNSGVFNPALDLAPEQREISHQMNFTELANFCLDLGAIYEEFQMIPNKTPRLSVVPPGAEDKNRYANILPIPETRVRLDKRTGDEAANFINANYVSGYHGDQKMYIATQAPLESTVGDFWRMVWEQQSRAVVMLINLHEDGHTKCATYFPDSAGPESSVQCGEYDVMMTKRDVHQEYIMSWLRIKTKDGETREVRHFWLTCWPLQSRPEPISLVRFVLDSRPQYEDSGAPLVVHCSNGTGRTGTFIALDICMRQFENRRAVDVTRCVHATRQERAGCVQTSEQYALVYSALQEYATILSSPAISAASSAATLHAILP